jgi:hypothetical protein
MGRGGMGTRRGGGRSSGVNPIGCLIAVLVVAAIAAAIYFFVIRDDDAATEPSPTVPVETTVTVSPAG